MRIERSLFKIVLLCSVKAGRRKTTHQISL